MAMVTGTRCRVEECFEDGKAHLGMADYETRSWDRWHHQMILVALAHLYVTVTKRDPDPTATAKPDTSSGPRPRTFLMGLDMLYVTTLETSNVMLPARGARSCGV
jgi:hypothetical protein